jgi:chitin disaccharide deacetylase
VICPQALSRQLIVNADDLGRSEGINRGIFEAHERGVVTSATLMVGFPAAELAAAELARHPRLGVGLHVTLTGAAPTLPPRQVRSLVDEHGLLPRKPEQMSGATLGDVLAEVRHQLSLFRRLTGRMPTHLDSHHHSHRLPVVLDALVQVAREHRLPIRRSSPEIAARVSAAGLRTTDRFDESFFAETATLETLLAIVRGLEPGVTELMCHPGYADGELRRASGYADEREREIAALTHPDAAAAMRDLEIELTHFGALCGS